MPIIIFLLLLQLLFFLGIIDVHPDVLGQNERIKSIHDNR